MGYMVKYCRNHNLFLIYVISSRGKQKTPNCTSDAHCELLNFVASAFSLEKLWCVVWLCLKFMLYGASHLNTATFVQRILTVQMSPLSLFLLPFD
jgi:hypothetical protein